jgi:hypothetical protein
MCRMADANKSLGDLSSASFKAAAPQKPGENAQPRGCLQAREVVDSNAVIRLINLAADVHGRIVDISLGGCHIRTNRCFPVGVFRRVEVDFCIDGLPFRFPGVTQAIYDSFNVGIRFLDLSDRKKEQLQQLIEEIRESKAAEKPNE